MSIDVTATVVTGSTAATSLPIDAYYVLTKAHATLTNSKTHANSGSPNYTIRHDHDQDFTNVGTNTHAQIDTHIANVANPHAVTLDLAHQGGNTITIGASEQIVLNVTRADADNTQILDINITDTSSANFNYIDITSTHGAGNKTGINISQTSTGTGDALGLAVYTETDNAAAASTSINTESTSTGGADAMGAFLYAYDQAGETACNISGAMMEVDKYVAGSTAYGAYIISGGSQAADYGVYLEGTFTTGIDMSDATVTTALKLAAAQKITTASGTLKLGSGDGKVDFADATVTGSTVTHDAYVELDVGGSTYKFMLGS